MYIKFCPGLGYTEAEARLGLRTMKGDTNRAANYINENREKRAESRKKALAAQILEKLLISYFMLDK